MHYYMWGASYSDLWVAVGKKNSLQQPLVLGDKFSSISKPPNYLDIKLFETPVLRNSPYPPIGFTDKKLKRHENTLHLCFFNLLETRLFWKISDASDTKRESGFWAKFVRCFIFFCNSTFPLKFCRLIYNFLFVYTFKYLIYFCGYIAFAKEMALLDVKT